MRSFTYSLAGILTAAVVISLAGCTGGTSDSSAGGSGSENDHGHEHGATHTHKGPHGGHVMAFKDKEYHAEWTHEESGKVTFYILDAEVKKEVPIDAQEITIEAKIRDNEPVIYKLAALNPQDGKTAVFETTDPNLDGALDGIKSGVVKCTLHVTINGKQYDEEIKEVEYGEDHHAGPDHDAHK